MAVTYKLIQTITVGSGGAANIEFTSIPQTYTDLKIVLSGRTNATDGSAGQWAYVNFNGATTSNSTRVLYGAGTSSGSTTASSPTPYAAYVNPSNFTSSVFSNTEVYIPNYTSANNKSYSVDSVTETNASVAYSNLTAGLWSSTAAIISIQLTPAGGSFVEYSSASLYGILKS